MRDDLEIVITLVGASTQVVMHGEPLKVNTENFFRATDEEKQGIEPELLGKVGAKARRHEFWDLAPDGVATERQEGDGITRVLTATGSTAPPPHARGRKR